MKSRAGTKATAARLESALKRQDLLAAEVQEQQRQKQTLQASEEHFRLLFEQASDGIFVSDAQGHYQDVNTAGCQMLGYSREEILRLSITDIILPEDAPRLALEIARFAGGRVVTSEWQVRRKDGSVFLGEVVGRQLPDGRLQGILRDVTDRWRAEETLRQSQEVLLNQNRRLDLLREAAAQLLSTPEPDRALARVYERVAVYFQTSGFFEFALNEQGDGLRSCFGAGEPEKLGGITRFKLGEGIMGTVAQQRRSMYLGHVQQSDNPQAALIKQSGIRAFACYPLIVGERLLGTLSFASCQRDTFEPEDQEFFETLSSYVALARERVRLTQQLQTYAATLEGTVAERTGKLREVVSELEHMSYSIIHDMRAPLRAIQGYAAIIQREDALRLSPRSQDFFGRLIAAISRMDLLITDALAYNQAVRRDLPLAPVNLCELLLEMLDSFPELHAAQADVRLEGPFPLVLANRAGLTQCFSNLLSNAVKFVPPGVKPQVRIWAELRAPTASSGPLPASAAVARQAPAPTRPNALTQQGCTPDARTSKPPSAGPNQTVRLWIQDNGIGIEPQAQEKIFDMFQRMHGAEYEGTGIGLALVRKVMQRMEGSVGVESEPGCGSRFWLELKPA